MEVTFAFPSLYDDEKMRNEYCEWLDVTISEFPIRPMKGDVVDIAMLIDDDCPQYVNEVFMNTEWVVDSVVLTAGEFSRYAIEVFCTESEE